MKREFRCEYCGKIYSDPIPHKCTGGFRKHHLRFVNLHPTNQELISRYKKELGIPRNLNTFELIDWLTENFNLYVSILPRYEGDGWTEAVTDKSNEREEIVTEDLQIYTKYKEAIESSILEALAYKINKKKMENGK